MLQSADYHMALQSQQRFHSATALPRDNDHTFQTFARLEWLLANAIEPFAAEIFGHRLDPLRSAEETHPPMHRYPPAFAPVIDRHLIDSCSSRATPETPDPSYPTETAHLAGGFTFRLEESAISCQPRAQLAQIIHHSRFLQSLPTFKAGSGTRTFASETGLHRIVPSSLNTENRFRACATLDSTVLLDTRQVHKAVHRKTATLSKVTVDLVVTGHRIRHIRGGALTQEEFARILGVGQTQLSRYELGQSAPTLNILLRLKIYSQKSIDWILLGEKRKENY
jgi:DNA-binding transcriptional regulator YiaG